MQNIIVAVRGNLIFRLGKLLHQANGIIAGLLQN